MLREARRTPEPGIDGPHTWSLRTLQSVLRKAEDGLPEISTERIWVILQEAGFRWQKARTWCETGQVARKRKRGGDRHRSRSNPKKAWLERAYRQGEKMGRPVWVEDEAGPYQTVPYAGESWQPANRCISRMRRSAMEPLRC